VFETNSTQAYSLGGSNVLSAPYVAYYCDAWEIPEGNGSRSGKWRITINTKEIGTQDDLYLKILTRPKYYGGDPEPPFTTAYNGLVNLRSQPVQFFDVEKPTDPPDEPDRFPWFFSFVRTEIANENGEILAACNITPN
jgi:hypothetical protein